MTSKIKVLLVEDHQLTRESLAFGLGKAETIEIVGEARDGQEALAAFPICQPDVVLMDIAMPVLNGTAATHAIKQHTPACKVIMLTSHGEREKVFNAFAAGADGYCMKDIPLPRLIQVIEMVHEGAIWIDPAIAGYVLAEMPRIGQPNPAANSTPAPPDEKLKLLSTREHEILGLIAEGLNNKDIADRLCLSLYTVKNHVSSIIQKLAVEDRTQAAVYALRKE